MCSLCSKCGIPQANALRCTLILIHITESILTSQLLQLQLLLSKQSKLPHLHLTLILLQLWDPQVIIVDWNHSLMVLVFLTMWQSLLNFYFQLKKLERLRLLTGMCIMGKVPKIYFIKLRRYFIFLCIGLIKVNTFHTYHNLVVKTLERMLVKVTISMCVGIYLKKLQVLQDRLSKLSEMMSISMLSEN